jgi:hypothetical protein
MALPVILFDRENGADGAAASGAGPATAVTGTQARTRSSSSQRVGFFGTIPDFSGVSNLGDHVTYLATSSGRKFFAVAASSVVKDTNQSTTGDTTVSSTTVINVGSTTGMSPGDIVRLANAGPSSADLYTELVTVSAGSFTVLDAPSATLSGISIICPKQLTHADVATLTSDTAWAIGGKRQNLNGTGSDRVPIDARPGWIIQLAPNSSGMVYNISTAWACSASGDTTAGKIRIQGVIGDPRKPRIRASANTVACFDVTGWLWRFEYLEAYNCEELVKVSSGASSDVEIFGCKVYDAVAGEAPKYCVRFTSVADGARMLINGCEFSMFTTSAIFVEGAVKGLAVEGCFIHAAGGPIGMDVTESAYLDVRQNLFQRLATGVLLQGTNPSLTRVEGNTFDFCSKGVESSILERVRGITIRNNTITNCSGFGLNMPSGTDVVKAVIDWNNFFANNSNRVNVAVGAHDTSLDPKFFDSQSPPFPISTYDFRVDEALAGLGWPGSALPGTATRSYVDIGCSQRQEPKGGRIKARILYAIELLSGTWQFGLEIRGGNQDLKGATIIVSDSLPANELSLSPVYFAIGGWLRDNGGDAPLLIGAEVRA